MSLLRRMRDITMATFHEMIDKAEDPVKLIDKYLSEKAELLQNQEKLYKQATTHYQSMKKQFLHAKEMMHKREQQALIAIKAGEERVARLLLQEKVSHEEKYEKYYQLYEQSKYPLQHLEEQISQLQAEVKEVMEQRQYYKDRMQAAEIQRKLDEQNGLAHTAHRLSAFQRIEDSIFELDSQTELMLSRLEKQYKDDDKRGKEDHHYSHEIEEELLKLKAKLNQKGEGAIHYETLPFEKR